MVVGSKVLDARTHVVLLNARDVGGSSPTCHYGVLGVVLEVTTAEGVTHDIQGGRQQHIGTILLHLFTNGLTNFFDKLGIPGGSQQGANGKVGAIVSSAVAFTSSVDAQSGRTVGQYDGRDAQRVEGIGGAGSTRHETLGGTDDGIVARESFHTHTNHEVRLVLERELGHHLFLIDGVLCHFVGRITTHEECGHAEGEKH